MKAQGVALQGALAAAALVAAFFVWQREPASAPGEVTVMDSPVRALDRVRYEDEARFVELYRDEQDRDTLWVRLGNKPPRPIPGIDAPAGDGGTVASAPGRDAPAGDGGTTVASAPGRDARAGDGGTTVASADAGTAGGGSAVAAKPPEPVAPPPPRDLRANEVAQKLFAKFAPLRAQRSLGELDAKKLEEVGLAKSARKLTLTLGGKPEAFTLASPAGGWGTPYLRRDADGAVFLLGPALLPDLEGAANRLVDRRLHTFDTGEFDTVVVTTGGVSRTYKATGQSPGPVQLAAAESPGTPDEFARNWHDRVWRLVPLDLLGRGEVPPGGEPEVLFRVEYQRGGKPKGELTVAKSKDGTYYARTEHTPGWGRLHGGVEPLASEASKVAASSTR